MNWWWTVHERLFIWPTMWTFQELLMNCSWTIFFITSSWTVHELWFYELFMNCSWTFMNVHECSRTVHKVMNYISPGVAWHRRLNVGRHGRGNVGWHGRGNVGWHGRGNVPSEMIMNCSWMVLEQFMCSSWTLIHEQFMNYPWTWNGQVHEVGEVHELGVHKF